MKQTLIALLVLFIVSCHGQKHSDHMGMRATTIGDSSLGCKDGHLWKETGNDDWVDIGPVTDSCNCNHQEVKYDYPCVDDSIRIVECFNMVFNYGEYVCYIPTETNGSDTTKFFDYSKLIDHHYINRPYATMMFCAFGMRRSEADSFWKSEIKPIK